VVGGSWQAASITQECVVLRDCAAPVTTIDTAHSATLLWLRASAPFGEVVTAPSRHSPSTQRDDVLFVVLRCSCDLPLLCERNRRRAARAKGGASGSSSSSDSICAMPSPPAAAHISDLSSDLTVSWLAPRCVTTTLTAEQVTEDTAVVVTVVVAAPMAPAAVCAASDSSSQTCGLVPGTTTAAAAAELAAVEVRMVVVVVVHVMELTRVAAAGVLRARPLLAVLAAFAMTTEQ
jgi:hypothetical protein